MAGNLNGGIKMEEAQEVRDAACHAANAVCDVLRYLGDVSYAILPKDLAHNIGEFNKSLWSGVRNVVDKEIEWIDERVAGGDKMREEWERRCRPEDDTSASEPVS
jgi:hypothetical protein